MRGLLLLVAAVPACARPWTEAPPLPEPTGDVVRVDTVAGLQSAVAAARSNQTILVAPGDYCLEQTLYLTGGLERVTIRGATGNPDDVVIRGRGMTVDAAGTVPHGILLGDVTDALIADLTIRDVWYHPISCQGGEGCRRPRIYHCQLLNAGEQFVKANPGPDGVGVFGGLVEYCRIEYLEPPRHDYTNGVDVIGGIDWTVRHCLFRRLRAPAGQIAGPAILMWKGTRGTVCESNVFVDCQRNIHYGLDAGRADDHAGGRIANNLVICPPGSTGDCGIALWNSAGTLVAHNTVLLGGSFPNAIEYRFAATRAARIIGNLTDAAIVSRDGATAEVRDNVTQAAADWLAELGGYDPRLRPGLDLPRLALLPEVAADWLGQRRSGRQVPGAAAN